MFVEFTEQLQPQVNPLSNITRKEKTAEETNNGTPGRPFGHRPVLTLYQSTRTQEKPLECNEDGKTFHQNLPFNVQQITHVGEKPYESNTGRGNLFMESYLLNVR